MTEKELRDSKAPTPESMDHNQEGFQHFGIPEVYLHRDAGDVSKAETCKEGSTFRISLPVSLWFGRKIGCVNVEWSIDTELPGSNGASELRIDFAKLDRLMADATNADVKQAISNYISRAKSASADSEKPSPEEIKHESAHQGYGG